ncbi:AAA family ATPase [Streptomyces graminilatus]|uniref:AAA family ATPase n=1 Tax=Streptomyces graminilatus TaxID=1464070 RepID=UPI0006E17AA6|nr:AAA family ATPase [Streptomyces graminilatus]
MYVTRLQVTDIKGFSGQRAVNLELPGRSGWTVLAGRNSSGKSTLLQAMALALAGPSVARGLVTDFTDWITRDRQDGRVTLEVATDTAVDSYVDSSGPYPPRELLLGLHWTRPDRRAGERSVRRPVMEGTGGDWASVHYGPWAENPRGWFCAGYGPFRRLTGGSSEAQRLMGDQGPTGRVATLFHEDASLAEGVAWLVDLRLRKFEEQEARREEGSGLLLDAALTLLVDGLLPDRYQIRFVSADGLWVGEGDRELIPLREMSDGYRTVAALVLDIVRQIHAAYGRLETAPIGSGGIAILQPGVVLIDEVDAHLHVTWQRRIGGWLREHFPNIQFIVSSHSPYICQAADEGALIRLPGPDESEPPRVVDEDLYRRVVYGSGDDAALSELFGLESPYSTRAEQQRQRLVALERKVYDGSASPEEVTEYQKLSQLLTSSLESRVAEVDARLERET